ncbi:S-layer homology domain-containing protein [Bacillus infantis]|uniref:S-layer homology domain-containing protein n=1 Tax=Bacillus infantis TaxID=324767 RepID=UPI003CF1CAC3
MLDKHNLYQKFIASAVTGVMVASAVSPHLAVAQQPVHFSDVAQKDYYYEAVSRLSTRGIINGYGNGVFKPHEVITRAQAAKMISLALKLETDKVKDPGFKDVSKTSWAYSYIAALNNEGIIHGYGDKFQPNDPITRAQLAKILTLAFKLRANTSGVMHFLDVNTTDWFAGYVQPLVENRITNGTAANTFSPNQSVSRGQMAAFLYRTELAASTIQATAVINEITDKEIMTDKGTYTLSNSQKLWLNPLNKQVLKGAVIQFTPGNRMIEKIKTLEIKASGQAAAENQAEFSRNLLFDGQGAVFEGSIKVSGDYITVKHLKIMQDLEIAKDVENDFYMEDVDVHGKTTVNGGDTNTVVFMDSKLNIVTVNKPEVRIEALGATVIPDLAINSNAEIIGDSGVVIPKVNISGNASKVNLQAAVDSLTVSNNKALSLTGYGDVKNLVVNTAAPVSIERLGQVHTLSVTQPQASLTLGTNIQVQNLVLPASAGAQQVIKNFDSVQAQVTNINGAANPAASSPAVPRNNPPVQRNPIADKVINLEDGPITIDVSAVFTDADNDALSLTAMSRAPGIASAELTGNQLTINPVSAGKAVIQMSATDGKQSAVSRFNITVNTKPAGTEIPGQTITLNAGDRALDLSSFFHDSDGDILTYTAESENPLVAEPTINGADLVLAAVSPGTTNITVTADDGRGGKISKSVQVLVNRSPEVFTAIPDQTGTIGEQDVAVNLEDVFRDLDSDSLTYSVESSNSAIANASLNGKTVNITALSAGETLITVTANDGKGGSATANFTIVVNQAPVALIIPDQVYTLGNEGGSLDLSAVFTDSDGDPITYNAVSQNPAISAVSVNGSLLNITPSAAGTAVITVNAEDGRGGIATQTFNVRVNRTPTGISIGDQIISLGSAYRLLDLSATFTDPDGDDLTLSAVSENPSIAYAEFNNKQLKITSANTGITKLIITASDSYGGRTTQSLTVTVKPNETPIVNNMIGDKTVKPSGIIPIDLTSLFSDPDQDHLTYEAKSSNPSAATAAVTGSQLTVNGIQDGTSVISVTATDTAGNQASTSFNISVSSNEAPAIVNSIPLQVIGAGVPGNEFAIDQLFSDSDGDDLSYSVTVADSSLVTPTLNGTTLRLMPGTGYGKTAVTVTAEDGNGGKASAVIEVNTVKVLQNKQITTKEGVADVSLDVSSIFPSQNNLTVYRQVKGHLTQEGASSLNGKVFNMAPGETGSTDNWWITSEDGSAAFVELNVEEQNNAEIFFSEYTREKGGNIALEIYNQNDSALNYTVIGYRYNTKTNQMEVMHNRDIPQLPYARVSGVYPGGIGMVINYTFYDLMDITPVQAYHDELEMTANGNDGYIICAFDLIKDGQIVDVIGNKNWSPGSTVEILPTSGTLIRKQGIKKGSTQFNLNGEFNLLPTTFVNLGIHKP